MFQALARRKATKFQPERTTIERLHDVIDQNNAIESEVNKSIAPINDTIVLKQSLKTTEMNNTTTWKIATDQSTQLDRMLGRSVIGPSEVETL